MENVNQKLLEDFQKELSENDKKVKKEIYTKDRIEMSKEFAEFIKKNDCKVIKGGKNGKN